MIHYFIIELINAIILDGAHMHIFKSDVTAQTQVMQECLTAKKTAIIELLN